MVASSYSRFDEDGNARFIRSIAEAQAGLGHEVHVLAPYSSKVRPYPSPVRMHWFKYVWPARWGVMGHSAALENDRRLRRATIWQIPLFSLSLWLHLELLIRRYKFDLIHAHWVVPNGVLVAGIARLHRRPLYISLHGSDMYVAQQSMIWGGLARWAFSLAKGVSACSQPLADAAIRLGAQAFSTHVIPYGADPRRFATNQSSTELRRQLDLGPDSPVVLAVGRLVGKKGFSQLVRAAPRIIQAIPKARVIILGEGPERAALEDLKVQLGLTDNLFLPGEVSWLRIPEYLALANVFVMPSVQDITGNLDGLPNVILEAMAAGCPVVATRIGGIPLAVSNGETGLLIDEADPERLGAAILQVLQSPVAGRAMGAAGRKRVETDLNWQTLAYRFDEMYGLSPSEPI